VFLARGDDPSDALAAAYGSGLHSSPVLLTTRDALPDSTRAALQSIAPDRVRILGGTAAVSEHVADAIRSMGIIVVRHAGADRYGTAASVAESEDASIVGQWGEQGRTALLANGHAPFDALAAGPLAAGQLFPVLLTDVSTIPAATNEALDHLGIKYVIVLGGVTAVSEVVVAALQAGGRTVRRVAGMDRMATAVAVAGLLEELGMHPSRAALASASTPADALGAGPWGAPATPVLLCETKSSCGSATRTWATQHSVQEVVAIGGPNAISDAALDEVAVASGP
jgi:putative cell wall-binding protein